METPNQILIDKLISISEPGTEIGLSQDEAEFLELETWDSAEILEIGGDDGEG